MSKLSISNAVSLIRLVRKFGLWTLVAQVHAAWRNATVHELPFFLSLGPSDACGRFSLPSGRVVALRVCNEQGVSWFLRGTVCPGTMVLASDTGADPLAVTISSGGLLRKATTLTGLPGQGWQVGVLLTKTARSGWFSKCVFREMADELGWSSWLKLRQRAYVSADCLNKLPPPVSSEPPSALPTTIVLDKTDDLSSSALRFLLTLAMRVEKPLQVWPLQIWEHWTRDSDGVFIAPLKPSFRARDALHFLKQTGAHCVWLNDEAHTLPEHQSVMATCDSALRIPIDTAETTALLEKPVLKTQFVPVQPPGNARAIYRPIVRVRRPLRILTYRWHVPHQYEIYKLPHEFTLVTDLGEGTCRWWDLSQRPLPDNVRFITADAIDQNAFDVAILHFDENVLAPELANDQLGSDWGKSFRWMKTHLRIPVIGVCHGAPRTSGQFVGVDAVHAEKSRLDLRAMVGDMTVVVNAHQAKQEWNFPQSKVIWHGFDPAEFSPSTLGAGIVTLPGSALASLPLNRGSSLLGTVESKLSPQHCIHRLQASEPHLLIQGNVYAWAKFRSYMDTLCQYGIYFNPTLRSPMPRSRGEAMMCGLATVSANNYDVAEFISLGVNGFYSNDSDELADFLRYLDTNPTKAHAMGAAGREQAMRVFHINRFLAEWQSLLEATVT